MKKARIYFFLDVTGTPYMQEISDLRCHKKLPCWWSCASSGQYYNKKIDGNKITKFNSSLMEDCSEIDGYLQWFGSRYLLAVIYKITRINLLKLVLLKKQKDYVTSMGVQQCYVKTRFTHSEMAQKRSALSYSAFCFWLCHTKTLPKMIEMNCLSCQGETL